MRRPLAIVAATVAFASAATASCGEQASTIEPERPSTDAGVADDAAGHDADLYDDGGDAAPPDGRVLSFLTLNLHGYHAMGEAPRFFEDRAGNLAPAPSSPFYFRRDELDRGNRARLDALAADLRARRFDVIALQEVGAGAPDVARDCKTFEDETLADAPHANTALRLARRLASDGYVARVACRGNIGWNTDPGTFRDRRIVRMSAGQKQVVHEFDSNPYPGGLLVEGFGLLYRAPLEPLDARVLDVVYNTKGDRVKAQLVALDLDGGGAGADWIVVLNVHGGHKVQHFEQAVALREAVSAYVETSSAKANLRGVVMLGDFNTRLHRPKKPVALDEPSGIPWEVAVAGQYSYEDPDDEAGFIALRDALRALNASSYKTFATLPADEANARIDAAITRMRTWQRQARASKVAPFVLMEALSAASANGACVPPKTGFAACDVGARIDHVFFGGALALRESHALYTNADDHELAGVVSDHPGVAATLRLPSR